MTNGTELDFHTFHEGYKRVIAHKYVKSTIQHALGTRQEEPLTFMLVRYTSVYIVHPIHDAKGVFYLNVARFQ